MRLKDDQSKTLNEKIAIVWDKVRENEDGLTVSEKRVFRTRMCHLIADELETNVIRVRERINKIESKR